MPQAVTCSLRRPCGQLTDPTLSGGDPEATHRPAAGGHLTWACPELHLWNLHFMVLSQGLPMRRMQTDILRKSISKPEDFDYTYIINITKV